MTVRWCPCPASIRHSPNPRRRKLHESLVSGTSRRRCPCSALIRQSPNPRRRKLHESLAPDRTNLHRCQRLTLETGEDNFTLDKYTLLLIKDKHFNVSRINGASFRHFNVSRINGASFRH
ncbi:hypothetical protein F2Q68_00042455 [Brassica cretica]|uniref:Uncharacterized protein n=1 Tax=Brassica cretica TaxID=69181 RepID=A0A8S9MJQ8_BRACR|nr:hypothetical protein F2Q68_00042455 [Brassica cretica]